MLPSACIMFTTTLFFRLPKTTIILISVISESPFETVDKICFFDSLASCISRRRAATEELRGHGLQIIFLDKRGLHVGFKI